MGFVGHNLKKIRGFGFRVQNWGFRVCSVGFRGAGLRVA